MARPKTNPEKHRQNVAITLDPDLLRQAKELAASAGKSLSQVIEIELRSWIELKKFQQAFPPAQHVIFAQNANLGIKLENMRTDLSGNIVKGAEDEDPFVAQAKIAAENTRIREEARKSKASDNKSKAIASAPLKRKRVINFEPATSSAPPLIKPKRKRIIE